MERFSGIDPSGRWHHTNLVNAPATVSPLEKLEKIESPVSARKCRAERTDEYRSQIARRKILRTNKLQKSG